MPHDPLSEYNEPTDLAPAKSVAPAALAPTLAVPPSDHAPSPGLRLRFTFARILRYKWTMAAVFVVVATTALVCVWKFVRPLYQAVAVIEVQPTRPSIAFSTEDNGAVHLYQQFLSTQVRKLTSADVVERVMARDDVQATTLFRDQHHWPKAIQAVLRPKSPGRKLMDALEIVADGTRLINVQVTLPDPDDAATIANAFVDEYLSTTEALQESDDEKLLSERRKLENRLRLEIASYEDEADRLRKMMKVVSPDELVDQQRLYLNELTTRRDDLDLKLATSKLLLSRLEALQNDAAASGDKAAAHAIRYSEDRQWQRLSEQLADVEFEISSASREYGDAHPKMVTLRLKRENLQQRLAQREKELDAAPPVPALTRKDSEDDAVRLSPETLRFQIRDLEARKEILENLIARKTEEFNHNFDAAGALGQVMRKLASTREQYESIKSRRQQQEIERYAPGLIRQDTRARRPYTIYKDPRRKLSLAALAAALIIAVGAGLARAYFAGALFEIDNLDDVVADKSTPLLGPMPLVRGGRARTGDEFALQSECMRMVRTALLQSLDEHGGHVVQITSAGPGAGKTTFAITLANSLAQIGKRVLLVDADLRNPSIARTLHIDNIDQDFLAALTHADDQQNGLLHWARRTSTPGLDLLALARPVAAAEAEILATKAPETCLTHWRNLYDIVLLDSSPVLPVADARMLARHTDGTVFVVREDHCHRRDVVDAMAYLRAAGGTLLGTVFNAATHTVNYHGAYHYAQAYAGADGREHDPLDIRVVDES